MKKLKDTKKITLATLKAFAKRNKENLYIKELSSFDGIVDCVMPSKDEFRKTTFNFEKTSYYHTGIQGCYTVGSSRDYFSLYEDKNFIGIDVYNSCGNSIVAIKKLQTFKNLKL